MCEVNAVWTLCLGYYTSLVRVPTRALSYPKVYVILLEKHTVGVLWLPCDRQSPDITVGTFDLWGLQPL